MIHEFNRNCCENAIRLRNIHNTIPAFNMSASDIPEVPELPPIHILNALKDAIEFAPNEIAPRIAEAMSLMQTNHAFCTHKFRYFKRNRHSVDTWKTLEEDLAEIVGRALDISCIVGKLFPYARGDDIDGFQAPNKGVFATIAMQFGVWDDTWRLVKEHQDQYPL